MGLTVSEGSEGLQPMCPQMAECCSDSLAKQRAASACAAGTGWHLGTAQVGVGHFMKSTAWAGAELALVAVGGFEVEADCRQALQLMNGSSNCRQHALQPCSSNCRQHALQPCSQYEA